jgi:hypothetical protein
LYLASSSSSTLDVDDHTTAAGSIIRSQLANGYAMATYPTACAFTANYCAYVNVLTTTGGCPSTATGNLTTGNCLTLGSTQGSVEGGAGSTVNPNWKTLSQTTYNNWIQDGKTGAKVLNLALALAGGLPITMIQRPLDTCPGSTCESPTSDIGTQRFFNQASVRILLSDTQADINGLPGIDTTVQPYPLAEVGSSGMSNVVQRTTSGGAYYLPPLPATATSPATSMLTPIAESVGATTDSDYMTAAGTTLLGGYIKIEEQLGPGAPGYNPSTPTFKDVTEEILAQGISRDELTMSAEPALVSGGSLAAATYYYVVTALGSWGESMGVEYGPYTTTSTYKTLTINWNAMTGATGYRVYRGTTAGGETGYIQYGSGVTSYSEANTALTAGKPPTNTSIVYLEQAREGMAAPSPLTLLTTAGSLTASKTYYYLVTALGAWGETTGTWASRATGSGSKNEITVNWTAFPGATGYRVYRTTTTDNTPTPSPVFTGSNGYIAVGGGTTYLDNNTGTIVAGLPPGHQLNSVQAATYAPNYLPINFYDPREGEVRDTSGPATSSLNGIMNLMEVDVHNLQQWFAGNIATSGVYAINGPDALSNSGYILYTSDRRMNCGDTKYELEGTCTIGETGEYGNEDIINPAVTAGTPNLTMDAPEDLDGDGVFRTYGAYAHPIVTPASVAPTGVTVGGASTGAQTWNTIISAVANSATENPAFVRITAAQAEKNSVVVFRRALRLVNGTLGNLPPLAAATMATCPSPATSGGFTVASENPVYVLGDYNASSAVGAFSPDPSGKCHVPAAVIGDAVTLLSNNWTPGTQPGLPSGDASSLYSPTWGGGPAGNEGCSLTIPARCATPSFYRMAVIGGKTNAFKAYNGTTAALTWGAQDTGTDGGVHNFLRYIEDWSGNNLNYLGSMASFFISRQGTGIYKYGNTVYGAPHRLYTFDTDFQNIGALPPGTPRFTDVNALSYQQAILSTQ